MTGPNVREAYSPRLIEDELKESFLDYSMSVIVQRALPDVRDGLKPVHRRILYAMNELGLVPGRPYKKARRWWVTCWASTTRTATWRCTTRWCAVVQDFSLRYPLVDGRGTSGRWTGTRRRPTATPRRGFTRIAMAMLEDIDKNTVVFVPNFDDRLQEPTVLPARLPNLM